MRAAANAPAALVLLILLMPAVVAQEHPAAEKLPSPTSLELRAVSWRPVAGDSYALIAGESGALLRYTGRFFINLSPNVTGALRGVGWDHSGSSALIVGDEGAVLLYNGQQILSMPQNSAHFFEDVKWRPQGDFALIAGQNGTLIRYAGGIFTRIRTNISEPITSVAWRPDGRIALLCGDFPFVLRYDPETDSVLRLETGSDRYFLRYAAWRPDGAAALVMGTLGMLFRYDGTNFVPIDSPTGNQWLAACWAPDNRTALLSARGGLLYQYMEGTEAMTSIATNTTSSINSIAYNLNGSYALGVGADGLVVRYPAVEYTRPLPTDGNEDGGTLLLFSAGVMLAVSLATVCLALFMVDRARRKARERQDGEEAEARAAELALAKKKK